ncbi:MAG: hypothetical protein IPM81_20365 [Saprospirales bacterium]|nr:hypothetical protein [Saprospirales bacterium]
MATVTVNLLPTATIGGTLSFCAGGSTTLTAGGGVSYLWDDASTNPVRNITAAGTYTVQVTDANGCTDTEMATVTVNAAPSANLTSVNFVCIGTSITLNGNPSGGTTPYSHAFAQTGGTGAYSGFVNNNDGTASITGSTAGSVTIRYTVTDANGCTATSEKTITVVDCSAPALTFNITDPCSCNNDQTANGAQDGSFNETVTVSPTTAGQTWTVTAINSLTGNPVLPTGIAVNDLLTFNAGVHKITFKHYDDAGYTLSVEGPNPVGSMGNVTKSASNICRYPVVAFDPSLPSPICESAAPITLGFTEANSFSGSSSFTVDAIAETQFDPSAQGVGAHTVAGTFTGTFVNNTSTNVADPAFPGCVTSLSQSVTVNAAPVCSITGPTPVCANEQDVVYSAPAGMSAYSWSVISGNATIDGAANMEMVTVDVGASGNFMLGLTITDINGCNSTCSETIPIELVQLSLTSLNPISVTCGDQFNVTIQVSNSSPIFLRCNTASGGTKPNSNISATPPCKSAAWAATRSSATAMR